MKSLRKYLDGPYCVAILFLIALLLAWRQREPEVAPMPMAEKVLKVSDIHETITIRNEVMHGR